MPNTLTKTESAARLHFRLPPEVKEVVERAAVASGLTVTDFAINALRDSAQEVLERQESRTLLDRDRDLFLALLDSPAKPNAALRDAVKSHQRLIRK